MKAGPRRVLIVGDRRREGVADAVAHHHAFLHANLDIVAVDLDEAVDLSKAEADLVLVFGGDGSILHVARRLGTNAIPILGVNYGRFGFLADVAPDDLQEGIHNYLAGEYVTSSRGRLRVRFLDGEDVLHETLAFNDVVLGRDGVGRMVDVDVRIDGRVAIQFSGDGLILATPTGSTAHSMAAGGPLLDPTINGIVMVPIAPHSLATRPVVLSGDHRIELSISRMRSDASVSVDGTDSIAVPRGHVVEVCDARAPIELLRVSRRLFFDALREKLGWRGRPTYRTEAEGAEPDVD